MVSRRASGAIVVLFPAGTSYRGLGTAVTTCRPGMGSGRAAAPPWRSCPRAVPCVPVRMIGSGKTGAGRARTDRAGAAGTRVGEGLTDDAVAGGPVGMLAPMAGPLLLIAKVLAVIAEALVGMARTLSAGALPPTAETLMDATPAVAARTPQVRMLLGVIAG
ncbi:hypothetical protein Misp02_31650 [Microtetraspora sp. NBRC 16547]|nr:hypothetical protein Misp02_31650 [Microtetraspora sp. NBRC 16547]